MLPLTLTLIALSLLFLTIALRGRTTARGLFCRRCKFDLAGLDAASNCPECGRDLTAPRSTRTTLRRTSGPILALSVLLLITGGSFPAVHATNNTARLLAALPDRVVHALHALGVDAALTEITTNRLTRTPALPDAIWTDLIAHAAAQQADTATPFDIRYGEVLGQAWVTGRLTDEQLAAYFELGSVIDAGFAASVSHGAESIAGELISQTSDRYTATNVTGPGIGGPRSMRVDLKQTAAGVRDPAFSAQTEARGATYLDPPSQYGGSRLSAGFSLDLDTLDWSAIQPGDDLLLYTTLEMTVTRESDSTEILRVSRTIEQPVRILPLQAETVALLTNPELVAAWANADLRLFRIHAPQPDPDTGLRRLGPLAMATIIVSKTPNAIAGRIVIRCNGRDTEVGTLSAPVTINQIHFKGFRWIGPSGPEQVALAADWMAAGTVDVLIFPDHAVAEQTKDIREIFGLPLLFEGVRVVPTAQPSGQSSLREPDHVVARPVPAPATTETAPSSPGSP